MDAGPDHGEAQFRCSYDWPYVPRQKHSRATFP
jgi:hypothetical protein